RLEAQASPKRRARARAVVFIFQSGGPSQHETFDPKPDAPDGIRGEYGTTSTLLSGVRFCEHLPRLAGRADRFSVVRTMHHIAGPAFRNEHSSCTYLLHTGSTALPPGDTNASIINPRPGRFEWPSIGSLLAHAVPADPAVGLPAVIELARGNLMNYPRRGPRIPGPRHTPRGRGRGPGGRAPPPAGPCSNCVL